MFLLSDKIAFGFRKPPHRTIKPEMSFEGASLDCRLVLPTADGATRLYSRERKVKSGAFFRSGLRRYPRSGSLQRPSCRRA